MLVARAWRIRWLKQTRGKWSRFCWMFNNATVSATWEKSFGKSQFMLSGDMMADSIPVIDIADYRPVLRKRLAWQPARSVTH